MIAIRLDKISLTYVSAPIFEGLSWEIHDDRITGLVGPNGSGKSSLLKLIHGDLIQEDGFIQRQSGLTIGYLPQEPQLQVGNTVWQEVSKAHRALFQIEHDLAELENLLATPKIFNHPEKLAAALDRQAALLERHIELGGPGFDGQLRSILNQLGFQEEDFSMPTEFLSGGQKKLVGLAKLLIVKPKLLLLDEPDNHLDLVGKDYLISFIRNFPGGVVIVSHDRYLLDLLADEIVDLEDGRLTVYPGNYSEYAFEKRLRLLRQQQIFQAQQKEINRLEQSAQRLLTWGHLYDNNKFIRRGQNILKRIERIDKIDRPVLERRQMGLELTGWRGSNKVLEIARLDKVFPSGEDGDHILFLEADTTIWHGERVGLVGPNGSGKSFLFKMILGQEKPTAGSIELGPSISVGYYAQQHETLDPRKTLIDTIRWAAPLSESEAVATLGKFLFTYQQACGLVSNLSGGERSRLQMALLMLSGANFLLLDEPTNNLDIPSAEVLEEALEVFDGTLLVISHDRYFLDRVTQKTIAIETATLKAYPGNYSAYREVRL